MWGRGQKYFLVSQLDYGILARLVDTWKEEPSCHTHSQESCASCLFRLADMIRKNKFKRVISTRADQNINRPHTRDRPRGILGGVTRFLSVSGHASTTPMWPSAVSMHNAHPPVTYLFNICHASRTICLLMALPRAVSAQACSIEIKEDDSPRALQL
jgi:hypothetical protein